MLHFCPACQRSFEEPGFCPFDRTQLVIPSGVAHKQTLLSEVIAAQPAEETFPPPHTTHVEPRRETFPLTPAPVLTNQIPAVEPTKIRSVSASDGAREAVQSIRNNPRENEYDKLVGQTLDGRYFVEKKIGEGGMGVVFSARHAVIERPLAIKVLKREVMRDTATIRRFVQEAKAASRIGHPNIVDVTDFGTTPDGMTYSVMEFVVGQTLGAALRAAAPFPAQRTIKIGVQIARALGAAHDKGITHRDLKPENVFLIDRDGRTDFVKIVDFGIAKVTPPAGSAAEPRLTRAGSVFGTPEYMAPEQAAGRGDTDARVDIYALGVLLYEMTCGRVPHRADSMVRTLAMQMLDPVEPPTKVRPDLHIPADLEAVILHALAKKREDRYQTMGELITALEKVQTVVGQSVTGSPVYALSALPPGADPSIVAAQPSRSKSPTHRRLKNEPEFVATTDDSKPHTFEHVFTETGSPTQRRTWPLLVLAILILGGAATAIALVMRNRDAATDPPLARDASVIAVPADAAIAIDAPVIVEVADAAVPVPVAADARSDATADVLVEVDAGPRRRRDAGADAPPGPVVTPNGRGTIMVQVLTKPEGATLYVGTSYRGPGGVTLEEPYGTRLEVRCTQKGYKEGRVKITFDGKDEYALCVLTRIKICIDNIKNVFDDCEIDPTKPVPAP
ncbi:MAG: Serine/threonine protein kinase PrkC, regulator of stationary phase [Myxococcales bacterium]|nr:Serine/threonine protein kinase PrkC, regulator of stationary phase [Myxococcales bacterium]